MFSSLSTFFHFHKRRSNDMFDVSTGLLQENMKHVLDEFLLATPGVLGIALVSVEGLPIYSTFKSDLEETMVSAMTAAMLSLGERVLSELGSSESAFTRILIEGNNEYIITVPAGPNAVLTVNALKNVKLGILFHHLKKCAEHVTEYL